MANEFLERAALYRKAGDEAQAERFERLAAQCKSSEGAESLAELKADESMDGSEDTLFEIATRINDDPSKACDYFERAQFYFYDANAEIDSAEWRQADRDFTKTIELCRADWMLAEAYAMRAHLRFCSDEPIGEPIEDVKKAIEHGGTDPSLYKDLANHYLDLAGDDTDRLKEVVSLYIAGLYHHLRNWNCSSNSQSKQYNFVDDLSQTYEKRAAFFRQRGKVAEAFEDEEKAKWFRRHCNWLEETAATGGHEVEFPANIVADCTFL